MSRYYGTRAWAESDAAKGRRGCDSWRRARGAVTSDVATARIGWPEACCGPCEARELGRVFNRPRVAMRGFWSGVDSFWWGAEAKPRTLVFGGKGQGREHPSLMSNGGKAGNARTLLIGEGRERPSLMLSGGRAENARVLHEDESRERPCFRFWK